MELIKMDTKYYLKEISEQLKYQNQKQDKIISLLKDIDMKLLKELGSPQDIKRQEFKDILYKMNIRSSQLECLKELVDLFNSVLKENENAADWIAIQIIKRRNLWL